MSLCERCLRSSIVFEACACLIESLWARVLVTRGLWRTWETFEKCGRGQEQMHQHPANTSVAPRRRTEATASRAVVLCLSRK